MYSLVAGVGRLRNTVEIRSAVIRRWSLWRAPTPTLAVVLGAYAAALLAVFPLDVVPGSDARRFLALALSGIVCTILCLRMERARKFLEAGSVPNLTAAWTFAGALSLTHVSAIALVVVMYGVQWPVQRRVYVGRPHRYVFGAATVIIGTRLAEFTHGPILGGIAFTGTNMVLIAAVLVASGNAAGVRRLADLRAQGLELFTLVLGWMSATLVEWHLIFGVAAVPVVVVMQYVSLRRSIRQPSTIDAETGALTVRAWNALGMLRLAQVREAIVLHVQVTDLGTETIAGAAKLVRASLRPEDLIGRGDDGFFVLVAGPGGVLLAEMLALQMRARLAINGIGTYVGCAVTPDGGEPVDLQGMTVTAGADVIVRAIDSRV